MAGLKLPKRRLAARLGLVSLARLLADFEPFRLRWALQHWPYPVVKQARSLMSGAAKRTPGELAGETELLKTRLGTAQAGGATGGELWQSPARAARMRADQSEQRNSHLEA